jgi:hypothetical protein
MYGLPSHCGDALGWRGVCRFGGGGGSTIPSTTTQTTSSSPWAGQQPDLGLLFNYADLAMNGQVPHGFGGSPQYFPGQTVATMTPQQEYAMNELYSYGVAGSPALQAGVSHASSMENPAFTAQNQGIFNAAAPQLQGLASGNPITWTGNAFNAGQGEEGALAGGALTTATNPAFGAGTPLESELAAGSYLSAMNPNFAQSQGMLSNELNGAYLNPNSDPGFQNVLNTTLANVLPQVNSSFISGNRADSGLATAAATNAATNAIGNLTLQNYLTERQNQIGAGQQAASNLGLGMNSAQQAQALAQQGMLGGYGLTEQAQQTALQGLLGGLGATEAAQQLASNNLNTQTQQQMQGMFAVPGLDQSMLGDVGQAYNAYGQLQAQNQNQINAAIDQWNYNQALPWNTLGLYQGLISGGYGGQGASQMTQPYYSNTGSNVLSGILGGATLGAGLLGPSGLGLIGGSSGGGVGLGGLAGLLFGV